MTRRLDVDTRVVTKASSKDKDCVAKDSPVVYKVTVSEMWKISKICNECFVADDDVMQ